MASQELPLLVLRRLAPGDALALLAFYSGLSEASLRTFRPLGVATTLDVCDAIVADNLPGSHRKYDLVAMVEDTIVGWSSLWSLDAPRPTFGLSVADAFHGHGLGSRLMEAVLDWARSQGIAVVELTVVQDNAKAIGLYERRGFVRQDEFIGSDGLPYYRMEARLTASSSQRPAPRCRSRRASALPPAARGSVRNSGTVR